MEVLGIDIGGSGIKGAIVDTNMGGLISERYRVPTPQPATPEAVAEVVADIIKHFKWKGVVGCGFPAPIRHGIVKTVANMHKSWKGININQFFEHSIGNRFYVLNDADAAGLAEFEFGAGRNRKDVILLITVGTGIGTVMFTGGQLLPNTELGHVDFLGKTPEKYVADSVRTQLDMSWKKWGLRFDEVLHYFNRLFYPDLVIIGGGISKKFSKYEKYFTVNTEVVPAQLLNQAGIIGAALAARNGEIAYALS